MRLISPIVRIIVRENSNGDFEIDSIEEQEMRSLARAQSLVWSIITEYIAPAHISSVITFSTEEYVNDATL